MAAHLWRRRRRHQRVGRRVGVLTQGVAHLQAVRGAPRRRRRRRRRGGGAAAQRRGAQRPLCAVPRARVGNGRRGARSRRVERLEWARRRPRAAAADPAEDDDPRRADRAPLVAARRRRLCHRRLRGAAARLDRLCEQSQVLDRRGREPAQRPPAVPTLRRRRRARDGDVCVRAACARARRRGGGDLFGVVGSVGGFDLDGDCRRADGAPPPTHRRRRRRRRGDLGAARRQTRRRRRRRAALAVPARLYDGSGRHGGRHAGRPSG